MLARLSHSKLEAPNRTGHGLAARRFSAALAAATALSLHLGFASDAGAANLKCHAYVTVKNDKAIAIKVTRFAYQTPDKCTGDKGCIEGLSNHKLSPGETHPWPKQTLGDVAAGNSITAVKIEYEDDTSGQKSPSDPWGKARWTDWVAQTGDCTNDRKYTVVVK